MAEQHTPYRRGTAWRTTPLPHNWPTIRARILERDPRCKIRTHCWGSPSVDVDHIGNPDNHDDNNLRGACEACHDARSAGQGADAAKAKRARAIGRTTPRHPGLRAK